MIRLLILCSVQWCMMKDFWWLWNITTSQHRRSVGKHDPSNDGMTFYKLNRAKSYAEYEEAIKSFDCPGQNFVLASKTGDSSYLATGKFPARWDRLDYHIMPGEDSSYMWQGFIPQGRKPACIESWTWLFAKREPAPCRFYLSLFYSRYALGARVLPSIISCLRWMRSRQMIWWNCKQIISHRTAEDARPILLK